MYNSESYFDSHECFTRWQQECSHELDNIVRWWAMFAIDEVHGGFYGEVDNHCNPNLQADKGLVLNARILWFFSSVAASAQVSSSTRRTALKLAGRSYDYFTRHFHDASHGGAYWSLDSKGEPKDTRKQTYGIAFAIYGFSAYYALTHSPEALQHARDYFQLIEDYCKDTQHGGYFECRSRDWQSAIDMPMSQKDLLAAKTMNNHLHILEAYTTLYHVAPTDDVKAALLHCLEVMDSHILGSDKPHLKLFMTDDWQHDLSETYSFGHDIEYSWLAAEAIDALEMPALAEHYHPTLASIAANCAERGLGSYGQLQESFHIASQRFEDYNEWWIQAEALVGFFNAYQLTGEHRYLITFERLWRYTKGFHIDPVYGEWFCCSTLEQQKGFNNPKIGFWKGPYHHGRALLEIMARCERAMHSTAKPRAPLHASTTHNFIKSTLASRVATEGATHAPR